MIIQYSRGGRTSNVCIMRLEEDKKKICTVYISY
jgi:hypothetical protein